LRGNGVKFAAIRVTAARRSGGRLAYNGADLSDCENGILNTLRPLIKLWLALKHWRVIRIYYVDTRVSGGEHLLRLRPKQDHKLKGRFTKVFEYDNTDSVQAHFFM